MTRKRPPATKSIYELSLAGLAAAAAVWCTALGAHPEMKHKAAAHTMPNTPPPPLGNFINVDGNLIHLYCTGAGSPTVMVVGGAFSFDWGLVQPEVAKFTRICTYDPSGTAWSEAKWSEPTRADRGHSGPALHDRTTSDAAGVSPFPDSRNASPTCEDRVAEIHHLLENAAVPGPYILVGFSIGGPIARTYAHQYPQDVAGMVIVDHAFIGLPPYDVSSDAPAPSQVPPSASSPAGQPSVFDQHARSTLPNNRQLRDAPPVLISSTPITLGLEDDRNFHRLPQLNQDLHTWAMSNHPVRPTPQMAAVCAAALDKSTQGQPYPLADKPLIVIRTGNETPGYEQLQTELLRLSRNSRQILAAQSSHMVIIDQPEVVISAIHKVVEAAKNGASTPPLSE